MSRPHSFSSFSRSRGRFFSREAAPTPLTAAILALLSPLAIAAIAPRGAAAHGARVNYQPANAVEIEALYDSGKPMAEANVAVYAPNDPSTPWTSGKTDERGRFVFVPDLERPGEWSVSVRSAGHGDWATIPIGESPSDSETVVALSRSPAGYTPLQKGLMGASAVWGFIGTALFFSRRSS